MENKRVKINICKGCSFKYRNHFQVNDTIKKETEGLKYCTLCGESSNLIVWFNLPYFKEGKNKMKLNKLNCVACRKCLSQEKSIFTMLIANYREDEKDFKQILCKDCYDEIMYVESFVVKYNNEKI